MNISLDEYNTVKQKIDELEEKWKIKSDWKYIRVTITVLSSLTTSHNFYNYS